MVSGQSSGCFYLGSCCDQKLVADVSEAVRAAWPNCSVRPSGTDLEIPSLLIFQPSYPEGFGCSAVPGFPRRGHAACRSEPGELQPAHADAGRS